MCLAVCASLWLAAYLDRCKLPVYEGKRVDEWFDALCTGDGLGGKDKSQFERLQVFSRMDSNAVPFLVSSLHSRGANHLEKVLLFGRSLPVISSVVRVIPLPSRRRSFAAMALREMQSKAEPSIPALVQALALESHRGVKTAMLDALKEICGIRNEPFYTLWSKSYETRVLKEVCERYPYLFPGTNAPSVRASQAP